MPHSGCMLDDMDGLACAMCWCFVPFYENHAIGSVPAVCLHSRIKWLHAGVI